MPMPSRKRKPHSHTIEYLPTPVGIPPRLWRAAYLRLSDKNDEQSVSIEYQRQQCDAYAARHGLAIVAVYTDIRTGKDPDRIAYRQMLQDADAERFTGVIFYDDTRLHRTVAGSYPVILLHERRPTFLFEPTTGSYDIEHVGIYATMSGKELENTRRRTMEQRIYRAKQGELMTGSTPYWIRRDSRTRRPYIDWRRAAWTMRAIRRYMRGDSTSDILAMMRTQAPPHLSCPTGGNWAESSTLMSVLSHPALYGVLYYSASAKVRVRQPDGTYRDIIIDHRSNRFTNLNGKAITLNVRPLIHRDGVDLAECRIRGGCPLDKRPTFADIITKRSERRTHPTGRPTDLTYPLRGRLACDCGHALVINRSFVRSTPDGVQPRSAPAVRLICHTMKYLRHNPEPKPCRITTTIDAARLWDTVRTRLISDIRDPSAIVPAPAEQPPLSLEEAAHELELIEAELTDLAGANLRLYERYDNKEISQDTYEGMAIRYQTRRAALSHRKQELLEMQLSARLTVQRQARLRQILAELAPLPLETWTDDQWAEAIRDLVAAVHVNRANQPRIEYQA